MHFIMPNMLKTKHVLNIYLIGNIGPNGPHGNNGTKGEKGEPGPKGERYLKIKLYSKNNCNPDVLYQNAKTTS